MIITKIQGGLGNQLFQYSAGLSLAHRNRTVLKLDLSWFEFNSYRQYGLSDFRIRENFASREEINLFFQNQAFLKIKKQIRKAYNSIFDIQHFPYPISLTYLREEPDFDASKVFNISGDIYLEGFWQSYKYILPEIEQQLRLEFTPRYPDRAEVFTIREKIKESSESVALHIRRGDYVTNETYAKKHGFIGLDYYENALKLLKSKLGKFDVYVFTDDIPWVMSNFFHGEDFHLVSGGSLLASEELYLMAQCNHQILANSTFSWWAGWLNSNTNKTVICPKKWMNDSSLRIEDLILSSWIMI
ncbi:alpha-1,2-fucosyltransferase [Leptolyngbya sp. FACHB-711]|uniref:alpha-1,2-fucosyltransferase n=1 Tax=Leptolyngbya sp. FACHB-711 TaxID=2692813 RepID=UPI00168643C2|nr:alpha-1,2-fucosyltransferase [Leptolyngbya sp. FACHB-711]MBD2028356.1 alpha-1,2-fucosyltransferase [Leptolyngbya sp. FACHB-711]